MLANPIRFGSAGGDDASHGLLAPPELGAHTDEVLAAAGFGATEIDELRAGKVIG